MLASVLMLVCRGGPLVNGNYTQGRSRSCAMPRFGKAGPQVEPVAEAGWKLFKSAPDALPCSQLSLSATEFADAPVAENKSIARFFAAAPEGTAAAQASADAAAGAGGVEGASRSGDHSAGGSPAAQKRQPKWERVRGTIAHSFAKAPAAAASPAHELGDQVGAAGDALGVGRSVAAADQAGLQPGDGSLLELRSASAAASTAADVSKPASEIDNVQPEPGGQNQHPAEAAAVDSDAAATPSTLELPSRSQSEPVQQPEAAVSRLERPLQRPMGRSRTATAAELRARRAVFELAAESAIATCLPEITPPCSADQVSAAAADGGREAQQPGAAGRSESAHLESGRQDQAASPPVQNQGGGSVKDAVDLSSIDTTEQGRILRDIASRRQASRTQPANPSAKRRSGSRGGRMAKRSNQDPRQMCMERFMGTS